MKKVAQLVVRFQYLIMILFGCLIVYSVLSIPKVNIEYDFAAYLPKSTDTRKALDIMDKEFVTYGATTVVIDNITYDEALSLRDKIVKLDGISGLPFENTKDYYVNSKALFNISFSGTAEDEVCVNAYNKVKEYLEGYDSLESVSLVSNYADMLAHEMKFIILLAAIVIIAVLLFTSRSYAEVIVLPIVFVVAAILNMGTNYWFGTISFVSNSICIILQLALAIDYSIILLHRYIEECENNPNRSKKDSMVEALTKSITEIFGSSLTTISGLLALTCMTFSLGRDLGFVLSKSIIWSILTVLLLMPGLLLMFSKAIAKTKHKNFVPSIKWLGRSIVKVRHVLVVVFVGLVVGLGVLSFHLDYCYTENGIESTKTTEAKEANEIISENFGYKNMFAVVVPNGDYAKQKELLEFMANKPYIDSALGLANVEVKEGYYLCDSVNYQELTDILGIDRDLAKMVFIYYAFTNEDYSIVVNNNIDKYKVTIIDLLDCVFELEEDKYFEFPEKDRETFLDLKNQLTDAKKQLLGPNYSRMVFNLNLPEEGSETFKIIEALTKEIKEICPEAICAGNSMVAYDLSYSFESDNILISVLTIVFVFIVLMISFKSWGVPIVLVLVIQGAIFINFGIPVINGNNLFFFVYLIANAIQMGATIDYAIVISGRYHDHRQAGDDKKTSVVLALNESFATIISSGAILTIAALLIGLVSTNLLISSIGFTISRGTIISILSVMLVLPLLLYFFDKPLSKTYFKKKQKKHVKISHEERSLLKSLTLQFYREWKEVESIDNMNNPSNQEVEETENITELTEENNEEANI